MPKRLNSKGNRAQAAGKGMRLRAGMRGANEGIQSQNVPSKSTRALEFWEGGVMKPGKTWDLGDRAGVRTWFAP